MPEISPSLEYGTLNIRNPERSCSYLRRLWAFYEGGQRLLGDAGLMTELLPKHKREIPEVYLERLQRAFYIGVAGSIVDFLKATLMSDPIRIGQEKEGEAQVQLEGWYVDWVRNVAPKGAPVVDLPQFMRECVINMLVTRESWVRVDLPVQGDYQNRGDQEKAGALDAWIVNVPTECVWDWKEDDAGALEWVVVHSRETPRASLSDTRNTVVERWKYYDRAQAAEYKLEYDPNKAPNEKQMVNLSGPPRPHRFGMVPFARKVLPKGLWAMDTLEGIQREHFNKRNALAWGEFQSLLPELYEFLGAEAGTGAVVIGENQQDAQRATNQPRGQGYVQERGADDDARYVGPPVEPFVEARKSCQELRDEMHRVMHLMALSVATNATSLGRSAASKQQDNASTAIVCGELGKNLREHVVDIAKMVSRARGEMDLEENWKAQGAAQFAVTSVDDVIDRALKVEGITIKSKTFHKINQAAVAEAQLGERATAKVMGDIEGELEENITDEDMTPLGQRGAVDLGGPMDGEGDGTSDEGAQETEPEDKPKDAAKAKGKQQSRKRTAAEK